MSQFEFLVMTEKNIFVYKLFLLLNISDLKPDLKICWFAVTWVCFFEYTWLIRKKNYHFEMEKIDLVLIYNIFVTKYFFSGINIKIFF